MLNRVFDKTKRAVTRTRGMRVLEGDEDGRAIVAAIRAARDEGVLGADSREWTGRIELMRARLNASMREISRVDFGAGGAHDRRSAQTMQEGVLVMETLGELSRNASKSPFWCRFLFGLIRATAPESGIEMGAALGISAAYQAAAFRLNRRGRFATLEGAPSLAEEARSNLRSLGLEEVDVVVGRFVDTLPGVLAARRPLDYVFVDGHHDGDATVRYFELLVPHLAPRAFLVFDDIAWSDGMRQAWSRIARDERIALSVDLGSMGVILFDPASQRPRRYRVPLH
ncbi:MAG TPA: class I SAM-dependent methyltransferase [Candidatus Krumholzibacteria bacterium]|nr:class I SAM-dependent methyltransferase [Candidatus Krumholzibacteria bacterium]